ncbi:hypothetical protein [Blastopirellula marina]|uniref:Uncharacterized protein n=1 Tax=Blastopirellula marina DSM 3645 TaxID=314230 RepID=A3ZZL5_9BACT|nr:hypothetical protein [Blastopirellula marina]EAQ77999.1 hypothetical protein DSM3645_16165 [Blastopirellula marina DSM 3645]
MSTAALSDSAVADVRYGWLRNAKFDMTLIFGVAILALASGAIVTVRPEWFPIILILDLWLLGYHHVVATFTRLAFDAESAREHRRLLTVLPWVVLAATAVIGLTFGIWALATIYLYWQWFHYTRQSYGISRFYSRKAGGLSPIDERLTTWSLYLVPLWGILYRSYQASPRFLGSEVMYLPTPYWLVVASGVVAFSVTAVWLARQAFAWRAGKTSLGLMLYMFTHLTIFTVGYVLVRDIDHGWLVLNVWHNAQYILIVWMFNANRFKRGTDPKNMLLSAISQTHPFNVVCYFVVCLGLTSLVYGVIYMLTNLSIIAAIPVVAMVIYQTINFHHYVVDGLIWKARKKKVQETMEIAQ